MDFDFDQSDRNGPLNLFKYRSLSAPRGREFVENVLLGHRMWWQSPASFNDPFDCNPVLVFGETERDRRQWLREAPQRHLAGQPRQERQRVRRTMQRISVSQHERNMRDGFAEYMQESSVTCFSMTALSPLMWAHYANSHQGVCLIFQERFGDSPWFAFDVKYSTDRPVVDLTKIRDPDMFQRAILLKSSDWSYEKECRMIDYRVPPGFRSFSPDRLKGVILGARIAPDDRQFVTEMVERRGGIRLFEARIDERRFAFNIGDLE